MKRRIFTGDVSLTEGNLFANIAIYSIPLILSAILQLFYNAADLIVCGRFGSVHSVGAISATSSFSAMLVSFFIGLSMGSNVVMAKAYGAKDSEKGKRIAYTSMILSAIAGFIIMIVGLAITKPGLRWMGTPDEFIDLSVQYMLIYCAGIPFLLIYNFGAAVLRAVGDSKRPFYILTISGVINVLLNLFFVIVCDLDVAGVAIATVVSQSFCAVAVIFCMARSKGFFIFKFREMHFYRSEAWDILKIGLPVGIRNSLFNISNILIQSSVNQLANAYSPFLSDGNGSAQSIEGFMYTAMNQVSCACASFVSANYGARKAKNIQKSIWYCLIQTTIVWGIAFCIIFPLRYALARLYVSSEEAIEYCMQRLIIFLATYFLCGWQEVLGFAMTGMGYSLVSMILTVVGIIGFRFFWVYVVFPNEAFFSLAGLMWSYPISWVALILALAIFDIIIYHKLAKKMNAEIQAK